MQRWKRLIYVTFLHFLPVFCQYPVRRQEVKRGNRHREKSWREDEMWETGDTTPPCRPTEAIINGLLLPDPQRHHQWAPPSRPRGIINELLHLGTQEWSLSGPIQAHRCHQWTPSSMPTGVINELLHPGPQKTTSVNSSILAHRYHQWDPLSRPTEHIINELFHPGSQISSMSSSIQAHRCHQWPPSSRPTAEVINEPSIQARSCHQWEPPSRPTEDNISEFLYPGP